MKKLTCVLLIFVMVLAFAACGGDPATNNGVTIYVPDKLTVYMADGSVYANITYNYEEGWQNKESFSVTMGGDVEKLGGNSTLVYSDKKTVQDVSNGAVMENYFDAQGNTTKMVNLYADGGRREVTYTYDDMGRTVSEEIKTYETANAEPEVTTQTYVYVETETGSKCTTETAYATSVAEYDKDGKLVAQSTYINGTEQSRTEIAYDAVGNVVSQASYSAGQKNMEMKYIWKAVQVSEEMAARLPQMKQAK